MTKAKQKREKYDVAPSRFVEVKADGPFFCYALSNDEREMVLGPFNSEIWYLKTRVPEWCTKIEVTREESVKVNVTAGLKGDEIVDPNPVTIPIECRKPRTVEDMVRQYVATAVSAHYENEGYESFEESDDFEVDDDNDEFVMKSPYELIDEYPIEKPVETSKPSGKAEPKANQETTPKQADIKPDAEQDTPATPA